MNRTRINAAWTLRSIAKWFSTRADELDPININRAIDDGVTRRVELPVLTSKSQAQHAIDRARAT